MHKPAAVCTTMAELLDLEVVDRNLYRGWNEVRSEALPRLYGGQVAAQALRAAMLTVPEGRRVHSLHGYFLRPGVADWPVILRVERDRDGRSFSARHVEAVQHGEVIFTMSASFHVHEWSGVYDPPAPTGVADPDGLAPAAPDWLGNGVLQMRQVGDPGANTASRIWARIAPPFGDDQGMQDCALTYLSDLGSGFADLDIDDLPKGGPSLDHAVWFQDPVRADEWVLIDMWPMKAGAARGLYAGAMRDRSGTLGAMLTQEILVRPPAPNGGQQ
jgi:acyl-CoA thioesterase II